MLVELKDLGANSGHAAKERQRIVDRRAPTVMRRLVVEEGCAEKNVRHCVVERKEVSRPWQGLRHGEPQTAPLSVMGKSETTTQKVWEMGTMQRAKMSKEGLEMAKRNRVAPLP